MAIFPCDIGRHKHNGKNVNCYVGIISNEAPERWSTRLCDFHWGEIEPHLAKYEVLVDNLTLGDRFPTDWCASCGHPIDEGGRQLFITSYPPKQDRKDYWLHIHDECTVPRFTPKQPSRAGA